VLYFPPSLTPVKVYAGAFVLASLGFKGLPVQLLKVSDVIKGQVNVPPLFFVFYTSLSILSLLPCSTLISTFLF